ncbi:calcium-binding protein [Rhizobium sp. YIM 134829]|uniref:calcium-binding protein n=1 Tax=Rhizobium sp. YIM 134829 TaxID=3390453 RepID=UPI00397D3E3A
MAFYSTGSVTVEQLRSGTGTISKYETVVFPDQQAGAFFFKIDKPLEGQQIAALSDVSVVDFGDGAGLIQNVAQLADIKVYQVVQYTPEGGQPQLELVSIERNVQTLQDELLAKKFPSAVNNSIYVVGEVGEGYGSEDNNDVYTYFDEFYISVSGDRGVFDQVYGQFGLDAPNDGRVLLTVSNITGARDLNWGNWLDTVRYDDTPPTQTELQVDAAVDDSLDEHLMDVSKKKVEVSLLKDELALAKERLDNLEDIDNLETGLVVLKGLKAAGDLASLGLAFTGVGAARAGLVAAKDVISELASSDKLASDLAKTFQDPSLSNINSTYISFTTVLTKSVGLKGVFSQAFSAAKATKSAYDFYDSTDRWWNDRDGVKSSIEDATKKIESLEDKIDKIENASGTSKLTFQSTKNVLTINGDGGSIKFLIGDGYKALVTLNGTSPAQLAASGKVTNYILGDDKQTVALKAGAFIVDGVASAADFVDIAGTIKGAKLVFSDDDWVSINSSSLSADIHGVNLVKFADALIAGSANDKLVANKVVTSIYAGGGADKVTGGANSDKLFGQDGNDTINGASDKDTLVGGFGKDTLSGGSGADTFVFTSLSESSNRKAAADVIKDFAAGDQIDVSGIDADADASGNQAFSFLGNSKFTGDGGELIFQKSGKNVYVAGDVDGDIVADFFIRLDGVSSLSKGDSIL